METDKSVSVKSRILNKNSASLVIFSIMIAATVTALFLGLYWHLIALPMIIFGAGTFLPFLFISKLKTNFIRPVDVEFSSTGFVVIIYDQIGINDIEKTISISWKDVIAYNIIIPNGEISKNDLSIKFKLLNKSLRMTFVEEKIFEEDSKTLPAPLLALFLNYIKEYNSLQDDLDNKISFQPNFFASKKGQYAINITGILIGFDILYRFANPSVTTSKNILSIFLMIFLFITMIAQQKRDQKVFTVFSGL